MPAAILGLLAAVSVTTARAGELDLGILPGAGAAIAMFAVMHLALRRWTPEADPYILPLVGVLTGIGLAEIHRLNPELARQQLIWIAIATVIFVAVLSLVPDPRRLQDYRYIFGVAAVLLLLATMVFGETIFGARLWIRLPGGQTVQPGELVKVLLVLFLAGYLRDKREVLAVPTRRLLGMGVPAARHFGPVVAFWGLALLLVVALNDFGTALLFFGVFLAMLFLASGRVAYVAIGGALFAAGSALVLSAVPRVGDRVDAWLRPFDDPDGKGYQLVQSLYAMADGGTIGPGLGQGFLVQANGNPVIPTLETDFIFAAIATELGFVGAVGVLLTFLLLVQRGFVVAIGAPDGFLKLLAGGLTVVVGLQALVIVGGIVRLIPLTGVTLPFMSYGGSSVVVNFGLIAMLALVSHRSARGAAR